MRYKHLLIICLVFAMLAIGCSRNTITHFPRFFEEVVENEPHFETHWEISEAVAYDALCFINVLTGDPFYTNYHKEDYLYFKGLMTEKEQAAVASLNDFRKQTRERLANLLVGFSHGLSLSDDLTGIRDAIRNPEQMKSMYLSYPFNSEEQWLLYFEPIQDDVVVLLDFLIAHNFEEYWSKKHGREISHRVEEIKKLSVSFNPIPFLEKKLGWQYHDNKIEVYVMAFANPTAFHFGYTGFITDKAWSADNFYLVTLHELMHPSVNMNRYDVAEAILEISRDPFVMKTYNERNTIFGYNNMFQYIEENIIQAMDRQFTPHFGVEKRSLQDWILKDEGMHKLGMAMYVLMEQERFLEGDEDIQDFLVRQWRKGRFKSGEIERLYLQFLRNFRL